MRLSLLAPMAVLASLTAPGCDRSLPVGTDEPIARVHRTTSSVAAGGAPSVIVNPAARGRGTARTITEGIEMVAPGGKVLVLPGTYEEALVIDKGLTLVAIGGESGPVVVEPPGTPFAAVEIATAEPVILRGLTVHARRFGVSGVAGVAEDLTIERSTIRSVGAPSGLNFLIDVENHAPTTGRARLVVRESVLDGGITFEQSQSPAVPQILGIRAGGDVDAHIEGNLIRRTGGACILAIMRTDFGGRLDADILNNDLDECYAARAGAIVVGPLIPLNPPFPPVTATGTVNIVGNTVRNSTGSCLLTTAIYYEFFAGRIERNSVEGVVQSCSPPSDRARPGAIWVGSLRGLPAANPVVRFNDLVGNAQAGLRVAGNITTPLDATCNWWGSDSGPSGAGTGSGDAVLAEAGGAVPMFVPFATAPIAGAGAPSC